MTATLDPLSEGAAYLKSLEDADAARREQGLSDAEAALKFRVLLRDVMRYRRWSLRRSKALAEGAGYPEFVLLPLDPDGRRASGRPRIDGGRVGMHKGGTDHPQDNFYTQIKKEIDHRTKEGKAISYEGRKSELANIFRLVASHHGGQHSQDHWY